MSFFRKVLSTLIYHEEATNDHLEAYPERLHVEALPERRYLKASRFWVVATLISLAFNFAMCFIYIHNASSVRAIVEVPQYQETFLYNLDHYNKELRAVEKNTRKLYQRDLIFQNLIADYLNERYQVTSNKAEMAQRWGKEGKLFSYAPKLYDSFLQASEEAIQNQEKGLTQEIYIYSIKNLNGHDFYEVVFDVFTLNENGYGQKKCPCFSKTKECLTCMRDTALRVQRKKAYMRAVMAVEETEKEKIRESVNPYYFLIKNLYILDYAIHIENPWENTDLILE
ncbi:MAG: hypothetical protein J6P93_04820 [Alphaproteobacteria bacterium]|nr:hypothetical protein [Alphaproteobacteria bacterium]